MQEQLFIQGWWYRLIILPAQEAEIGELEVLLKHLGLIQSQNKQNRKMSNEYSLVIECLSGMLRVLCSSSSIPAHPFKKRGSLRPIMFSMISKCSM